jgi:5-formyltetrahydrofolate cyclo-ligase
VVETLLAYWPLPDEVDIRPLLDRLLQEGKTILLPKVVDGDRMELRRYTSAADLVEGSFHIMEPIGEPFTDYSHIDVAIIPGMAFDAAGHRLGRGKGYYDRFLATYFAPRTSHLATDLSPLSSLLSPLKIGVCFPFQRVAEVPVEDHDVSVDMVV